MLVQLFEAEKSKQNFIYRWRPIHRYNAVPFVMGTIALAPKVIPAWVGYAVTAGIAAISIGTSYLLKPNVPSSGVGAFDNPVIDPETYLPVIYGKTIMPFLPVFMDTHPENIDILMGIGGQCHGRIQGLYKIYFGNMELVTKLVDDTYEVSEKFKGKVEFWQRRGGDTPQPYEDFVNIFRKWTSKHLGAGVASIAFRIHFDKNNITSIPSIQLIYKGKLLYDPRTKKSVSSITRSGNTATVTTSSAHELDTGNYVQIFDAVQSDYNGISQVTVTNATVFTFTVLNTPVTPATGTIYLGKVSYKTNPVLAVLDYLTHTKYGTNANMTTDIDTDSFIAEANYCDELIDYQIVDPPKKAPKVEIVERPKDWLTSGATYKYKYSYVYGTTIEGEGESYTRYESALSPEMSSPLSVASNYGRVQLTGILDSGESYVTAKRIYRQKNGTGSYYHIGTIDADETTFIDDVADINIGDVYATTISPPPTPTGAITATFTNYASSALLTNKYYRYKFALVTSVTPRKETAPSPASKRIKTKSTNTAIRITGIPESEDGAVVKVRIYRSEGFTANADSEITYKHLVDVDNGTSVYVDLIADTALDNTVTPLAASTTTSSQIKRFTCNGLLDTGEDISTNREKLLSACRGKLYKQAGKWKIFIPKIVVPETFELNENNIIGDWSFSLLGASSMPNTVKASFINPDTEWKSDTVIWPKIDEDNLYLKDDNGLKSNITLDLPFTTDKYTAKTICQVVRKEARNNVRVELTAKEEARKLTVGRCVKLTHSIPGWTQKKFWVEAVGLFPNATVRLILLEYTETDYNYETLTEDILPGSDTTFPDPTEPPDEVTGVTLTEELFLDNSVPNWRIKGSFTNPTSAFWSYSDVYIKAGTDSDYELYCKIDKLSEGRFYIQPIEPLNKYYVKICSVSSLGAKQDIDDVTEYTLTINPPTPDGVSDLEIENRGSNNNVFGNSFKFRWSDKSSLASDGDSKNSYAHQQVSVTNENIKYLIELYASGIPSTVKLAGLKANERALRTILQKQNTFEYTVDNAIADSKKMFSSYENNKNHAWYKAYYGIPQREIKIVVKTLNGWSVLSSITVSKIFTNKAPDMLKRDGVTLIKPDVETILNGAEIKFSHPPDEYDINYFMLLVAGDATTGGRSESEIAQAFGAARHKTGTTYVAGANGNVVYPADLNGHCYKCTTAGTSDSTTAPTFTKPSSGTLHPTINDGTVVWTHWCILRQKKISAQITVDSTEDEIDSASYEVEIKKLDRKKTYYAAVVPYDAYGVGTISAISDPFVPGESEDDSKTQIIEPSGGSSITVTFDLEGRSNGKVKWTKDSANDRDSTILQWRGVEDTSAVIQPTQTEASNGVTAGGKVVISGREIVDVDDNTGNSFNWYTLKDLKSGFKYFARIRYVNKAQHKGNWSHTDDGLETWATHSGVIQGVSADDLDWEFKKYIYEGSFSASDYNTVAWAKGSDTGKIKFKKSDGTTTDYTITDGNTGNVTVPSYIVHPGDAPNANTKFKVISVADFWAGSTSGYTPVAYVKPASDTQEKAFYSRFSDKKDFAINSSFISALSIITGMLQAGAVTAEKISVTNLSAINSNLGTALAGSLTLNHDSGGFIKLKDSSGNVAIRIKTNSSSNPDIVVMKSGYDADNASDAEEPSKVAFSTKLTINSVAIRTSYKKIIDEFIYTIPDTAAWQNKIVTAGQNTFSGTVYVSGSSFPAGYGITLPREVVGIIFPDTNSAANCETPILGATDGDGSNSAVFQYVQIQFRVIGGEGYIRLDRVCVNPLPVNLTLPSLVGNKIKITVYADQVG